MVGPPPSSPTPTQGPASLPKVPRLEECEGLGGTLPGFPPFSWAGKASSELDFEKGREGVGGAEGVGRETWE